MRSENESKYASESENVDDVKTIFGYSFFFIFDSTSQSPSTLAFSITGNIFFASVKNCVDLKTAIGYVGVS